MKSDILLYVDAASSDDDLRFLDTFLPDSLAGLLRDREHIGMIYYSVPETYRGSLTGKDSCFVRGGNDDVDFWKDLFGRTQSENLCKIHADSPFLDPVVIGEMIELHLKYLAEFTFSENLPAGFSCEIVSRELISAIPEFNEKTLPLAQVIKSNINNFDIEIYYKDPDIRDKRISFLSRSRRDTHIMKNIFRLGNAVPAYQDLRGIIDANPGVLYIGPSYLELELTGRSDLDCLYSYRSTLNQAHGDMDPVTFGNIIAQMRSFNLPYALCFGGSGEPLMNPNFYEFLSIAVKDPLVETILVETNGLCADINYSTVIRESGPKIKTIVAMNGMNPETYTAIHGKDFFERVQRNILDLKEASGDRLYIQIMKIRETEPFLDAYYDYWEKLKIPIILQKQNTFLGRVTDRRYSDLSPLERIPCWHLQRDLFILADGSVCFCKQDIDGELSYGNLNSTPLSDMWEKKRDSFIRDYRKDFPAAPDCKSCDEWYTFNL